MKNPPVNNKKIIRQLIRKVKFIIFGLVVIGLVALYLQSKTTARPVSEMKVSFSSSFSQSHLSRILDQDEAVSYYGVESDGELVIYYYSDMTTSEELRSSLDLQGFELRKPKKKALKVLNYQMNSF